MSQTPYLLTDPAGKVYMTWQEKHGDRTRLLFATLKNNVWTVPSIIAEGPHWFVNWADYPAMAVDSLGNMIAHFLQKSDTGKYTYDVLITASANGGRNWTTPRKLHNDTTYSEHGFVSMTPCEGGFMVAWLDGRNTIGTGHDAHHHTLGEDDDTTRAMTLRAALLDHSGNKKQEWLLDDRVCDCCQTSLFAGPSGITAVYRDRSAKEIRDMSVVQYKNGYWSAPRNLYPDQWQTNACPVNGPRIQGLNNALAVAWFTSPNNAASVKLMASYDGGASFQKPVSVDLGKPLGRVGLCWLNESKFLVSWLEGDSIRLRPVGANGYKGTAVPVAACSGSRKSGFPQMVKAGKQIVLAWTDVQAGRVKTGIIPLQ